MSAKPQTEYEKAERRRRHTAAGILTVEWLESLTYAIESLRGKAPALTDFVTSERLALVVAHVVTKPRNDDKPPSPLTVAQEIGSLLGATERGGELAGAALLGMAECAGFVVLADGKRRAGYQAAKEVRLSIPAEAQRAEIEARLAASDVAPARPLLERPPLQVTITPNVDDTEAPPQPIGLAVAESLAPIQATAWRVNRFILETLRQVGTDEKAALAQAGQFSAAPEFFYRCTFDWRGRLYQQGGRLQYTSGTDAARALLEFAHGAPLTPDGYTWLTVHVATCYGVAGSFTDRAVWTHSHAEEITQAVANPIGSAFWRRAKQPFRFLAACQAWSNPTAPVHIPVTADATASVFQHYAWLLRDEELAAKVNLAAGAVSARPTDFYGRLAQLRTGGYSRKEIKAQAWMFYGKSPDGPRERAAQSLLKAQAPRAWALYLALRRAATREAEAGRALEWTLPDGFRVRQAYREDYTRKVELYLHTWKGAKRLQARRRELLESFDIKAQARGLPPNLIHSLDACLLRAVVREAAKVSRWAVAHDSLGVHPNDGGRLRAAIVEAVECMYGPDLLSGLLSAWTCDGVEHPTELPASMRGGWYTFS